MNERRVLLLILALYLLVTTGYGALNPLFEAPDEQHHYFTVQTIAETGRLPEVAAEPDPWMGQEAAQPPLYYLLGSVLIAPLDTSAAKASVWFNPYVRLGYAESPTNINAFVHTPAESWPWRGYALAAHLLRLFSTLIGLGTLVFIYLGGKQLWPHRPERPLLAVALVAFLPQFNFLHASISNDPLIVLACTAALWQLLRLWYQGVTTGRLVLLGLTVGLAILSKTAGLLLLAYAGLWLLVLAWRDHGRSFLRKGVVWAGLLLVTAGLLGGPLLWRNWILYGDITAASQFIRLAGGDRGYTFAQVLAEMGGLWRSLFAVFGWMNVAPPSWVYMVWYGLALLAVGGGGLALWWAVRVRSQAASVTHSEESPSHHAASVTYSRVSSSIPYFLLALWVLLVYAGLVQFLLRTPAAQGRLLFPALLPLVVGMVAGLAQYRRNWLLVVAPVLALATTLYSLLVVIPQAYAIPPLLAATEIPAEANPLQVDMGHGLTLVAAEIETENAQPGDRVWLTLYWQRGLSAAVPASSAAPELVVEIFGREWNLIGKLQTYHGGGLYPANLWPAGPIIADRIGLQMAADVALPVAAPVQVRLVDGTAPLIAGQVKLVPEDWPDPDPEAAPLAQLGTQVNLLQAGLAQTAVQQGDTATVEVTWHVQQPLNGDYTTFVHLGRPEQPPLVSGDAPPLNGFYPTRFWQSGELFDDQYALAIPPDLPPGRYPVWLGMYNDAGRLPLYVGDDRLPNDAYPLGWLDVSVP